jgi:hypothetical protein
MKTARKITNTKQLNNQLEIVIDSVNSAPTPSTSQVRVRPQPIEAYETAAGEATKDPSSRRRTAPRN